MNDPVVVILNGINPNKLLKRINKKIKYKIGI